MIRLDSQRNNYRMIRAASNLLTGAMAVATALVLVLALTLIPIQGARAEILPIPMDVQFNVSSVSSVASADAEDLVAADAAFQEAVIVVLENSHGDVDEGGDKTVSLSALTRLTVAESRVQFPESDRGPHWCAPPRWRPPTHLLTGA
ncbi:hypothetical protein [Azospirillum soli]|uniref:hypothetical protein n=1 Tax=Azospirillum soli TaxID=1304799 RepID=UPI001AE9BBD8|nr:hypothetical protein [Azospirillum soli]MBP2316897.1 hypothetical protein [Azospirillum soli]